MCRHSGFRWGELGGGKAVAGDSCSLCSAVLCCVFSLICIVVVAVPFVCCSVELPLSRLTGFCLFLSILLRTPAEGGVAMWPFCCWPQPNYKTSKNMKYKDYETILHKHHSQCILSVMLINNRTATLAISFKQALEKKNSKCGKSIRLCVRLKSSTRNYLWHWTQHEV